MDKNNESVFLGALVDERPESEKQKDYKFEEMVAAAEPVNWVEKEEVRQFPISDQDGSGSCVAQSIAKLAGIMYSLANDGEYVQFSATHVYQRRFNAPDGGMNAVDAWNIATESITLEELVESQNMSDAEMDAIEIPKYKDEVGKIFGFSNFVELPTKDIDTIASVIQKTGKGVMVWFYFKTSEWKRDIPTVKYTDLEISKAARHSVVAVDFMLLPDGCKALIIEDSWGPDTGINGQRIITEDFFMARNWYAAYPLNFKFDGDIDKPAYTFNKNLEWEAEASYDQDVVNLQNILKYEGLFPTNVESTGYYGSITAKAVLEYQLRYLTDYDQNELHKLQGRIVGPATRESLNQKYSS